MRTITNLLNMAKGKVLEGVFGKCPMLRYI